MACPSPSWNSRTAHVRCSFPDGLTRSGGIRRELVIDTAAPWYLLVLLTGEHPAIPGARKPFSWYCTGFRYSAPGPLRAFLHQQAEASLARHGITEPVAWEPPARWVTWEGWPGIDPASLPGDDLAAVLAGTGSVHDAADALRLTAEHVRLCCEIAGIGPTPATANGLPVSPSRADVLGPARLRDLYEHQNLPMTEIAAMAGCATATIRRLLEIDGVPQRTAYRRPPPESGITREWRPAGADHPDPRPRQHRRRGARPLRRARRRPAADDREDRDGRGIPHHRQVRHASVSYGCRP
jgi:hypothetical protein